MTNRYAGTCCGCGSHVQAEDGVYDGGNVWCEEPSKGGTLTIDGEQVRIDLHTCPTGLRIEARMILRGRAQQAAYLASPQYAADLAAQAQHNKERAIKELSRTVRGMVTCGRCGGAGGHASWPGWACYDCGGSGELPVN